jgi:hypothetical protein
VNDRDSVIQLHADIVVEHAKQAVNADASNPHWLYLVVAFAIHAVFCDSPGNLHFDPPSTLVQRESKGFGTKPRKEERSALRGEHVLIDLITVGIKSSGRA